MNYAERWRQNEEIYLELGRFAIIWGDTDRYEWQCDLCAWRRTFNGRLGLSFSHNLNIRNVSHARTIISHYEAKHSKELTIASLRAKI